MPDEAGNVTMAETARDLGWTPLPQDGQASVDDVVDQVVEAAPVIAPVEAAKPVVPPAPTAVPVDPLAQTRADLRAQQAKLSITDVAVRYREQLINSGADPAVAQAAAESVAARHWAEFQRDETLDAQNALGKQQLIAELAREHGVDPTLLSGFQDPQSMRAAAAIYGTQTKRLAELEAKVAPVKTPVQKFDGGGGMGGSTNQAKRTAYAAGKGPAMTAAEFEAAHGYNPL